MPLARITLLPHRGCEHFAHTPRSNSINDKSIQAPRGALCAHKHTCKVKARAHLLVVPPPSAPNQTNNPPTHPASSTITPRNKVLPDAPCVQLTACLRCLFRYPLHDKQQTTPNRTAQRQQHHASLPAYPDPAHTLWESLSLHGCCAGTCHSA